MEALATFGALIALVAAILERRWQTAPQRAAQAERKDATGDVQRLNQALRAKDADGVAAFFEQERLEAWGRLTPGPDVGGVQPSRRDGDDPGRPHAGGQP